MGQPSQLLFEVVAHFPSQQEHQMLQERCCLCGLNVVAGAHLPRARWAFRQTPRAPWTRLCFPGGGGRGTWAARPELSGGPVRGGRLSLDEKHETWEPRICPRLGQRENPAPLPGWLAPWPAWLKPVDRDRASLRVLQSLVCRELFAASVYTRNPVGSRIVTTRKIQSLSPGRRC